MRVTQDDFYKRVAKKCGCPNYVAANYVRAVFAEIADILLNEDSLTIEKFGRFETYRTKARVGTDPNTLEKKYWNSNRVAKFSPSMYLANRLRAAE